MSFQGLKVLVLDGSGRQALPVVKWLNELGCDITTLNTSKLDVGYNTRYAKHKVLVPKNVAHDIKEVQCVIDSEIKTGKYDVVIPLSDLSSQYLSEKKSIYESYAKTIVPEYDVFMRAYDKQQTMEICQQHDIPCTITKETGENFEAFINKVGYPIVAKPRSACGSVGFKCLHNEEEWNKFADKNDDLDLYVIQEYVNQNGRQYNVHMFMDDDENVSFSLVTEKCRWFPVDGGASCFLRTVDRPEIAEQCIKLLKAVHWRGYCDVDLIEDVDNNVIKVIEINGRTSANIKICELMGINVVRNMLENAYRCKVTNQHKSFKDVRMRCIHTDLLWLIKKKKPFKTKPCWFNNSKTKDQIFSIKDPKPFFSFSVQALMKYKTEIKKRGR